MKVLQTVLGLFLLAEKGYAAVTNNPLIISSIDFVPHCDRGRAWFSREIDHTIDSETKNGSNLVPNITEVYIVDAYLLLEGYQERINNLLDGFKSDITSYSEIVENVKVKSDSLKPIIEKISSDIVKLPDIQRLNDATSKRVINLKRFFDDTIRFCDKKCDFSVSKSGSDLYIEYYYCGFPDDVHREITEYSDDFEKSMTSTVIQRFILKNRTLNSRFELFEKEAIKKANEKLGKVSAEVIHLAARFIHFEQYLKGLDPKVQLYQVEKKLYDVDNKTLSTHELVSKLERICRGCIKNARNADAEPQVKANGVRPWPLYVQDQQLVKERFVTKSHVVGDLVLRQFDDIFKHVIDEIDPSPKNIDKFLNQLNPALEKLEKEVQAVHSKLVAITKTVPYKSLRNITTMLYGTSTLLNQVLYEKDITQDYINRLSE